MRFDITHHDNTDVHINLVTWKNELHAGTRNKPKSNIHIFFK